VTDSCQTEVLICFGESLKLCFSFSRNSNESFPRTRVRGNRRRVSDGDRRRLRLAWTNQGLGAASATQAESCFTKSRRKTRGIAARCPGHEGNQHIVSGPGAIPAAAPSCCRRPSKGLPTSSLASEPERAGSLIPVSVSPQLFGDFLSCGLARHVGNPGRPFPSLPENPFVCVGAPLHTRHP